jgi:predicted Zn-dependent protease
VKSEKRNYEDIRADFEEALRLRDAGTMAEAEAILSRLARQRPDVAAVFGVLGDVQEEQGKMVEAEASYRRATELSPTSELSSISLFHALYALGNRDGAFEEMRRFRTRRPSSPEYDQLIRDLKLDL